LPVQQENRIDASGPRDAAHKRRTKGLRRQLE
jgi:hypothetical protein